MQEDSTVIKPEDFGVRKLGPGIWEDLNGGVHFSVPELLAYFDIEDTPANRADAVQLVHDLAKSMLPNAKIVDRP